MKKSDVHALPPLPDRPERQSAPLCPRLIMEISRLLRARMPYEDGVMAQSTARLVMSHLAMRESMGQLELVHITRLKPPTVSVLLRRMEEEGYVKRVPDDRDRRAVRVALTERGRQFDRERLQHLSTNDHLAVQGLTGEECRTLEALLLRVRENLQNGEVTP